MFKENERISCTYIHIHTHIWMCLCCSYDENKCDIIIFIINIVTFIIIIINIISNWMWIGWDGSITATLPCLCMYIVYPSHHQPIQWYISLLFNSIKMKYCYMTRNEYSDVNRWVNITSMKKIMSCVSSIIFCVPSFELVMRTNRPTDTRAFYLHPLSTPYPPTAT